MPVITREQLREQLRRREIAPVYLLYGAETYLRDLAAETIANFCFSEGDLRDFNDSRVRLESDDSVARALAAAAQLPMMASRRVIRLTGVRIGQTSNKDTLKEENEDALGRYLSDPVSSATLIFVGDEINGNRKLAKLLKDRAVAVEFSPLNDQQLAAWAADRARDLGLMANENVLRDLVALVGNDVRRLETELKKLSAAAMPDGRLTTELIGSLVPNSREMSNFVLTDHLNAGRGRAALEALAKVLDDGAEPLMLLGSVSYNYRRLLMARDLMDKGADRREVERVLNLRYGAQEAFIAAARRSDKQNLVRAIDRIAAADVAMKSSLGGGGNQGARLQIEMLVCELASLGPDPVLRSA